MNDLQLVTLNELRKVFHVRKQWIEDLIESRGVLGILIGGRKKYLLRDVIEAVKAQQQIENRQEIELIQRVTKTKSMGVAK